jgi:hypothetical protein
MGRRALRPDQGAVDEFEFVAEGTRFTYKSTGCEPPDAFSRLAMRARISRRVKGSTGYSERGSKRLDCLRPEETFRGVRTGRLYDPFRRMARIGQDG